MENIFGNLCCRLIKLLQYFTRLTPLESFTESISAALHNLSVSQNIPGISDENSLALLRVSRYTLHRLKLLCSSLVKNGKPEYVSKCQILTAQLNSVDTRLLPELFEMIEEILLNCEAKNHAQVRFSNINFPFEKKLFWIGCSWP